MAGSPVLTGSYWDFATALVNKTANSASINCYPNPFNHSTRIELNIEAKSNVIASVYDIRGKLVKELYNGEMQAGVETLDFDGSDLEKGIYFAKIATGNNNYTVKMILK
jgi:flagellar hook assembly protein FlgD